MIITLKVGAAAPVTLCHGSARGVDKHVGPKEDISGGASSVPQIDQLIGAEAVTISDRKNLVGTLRFGISVEKASVTEAAYFAATYPWTAPRFGTLRLYEESSPTIYVEFPTAHVSNIDARQNGVAVDVTYVVALGAQTAVHP